jgi:hypothetical protein
MTQATSGMTFRSEVVNDSVIADSLFFTVNLYSNNNDIIPFSTNRTTWSSPFTFSGSISLTWLEGAVTNGTPYFDTATIKKYVPYPQFYSQDAALNPPRFWDLLNLVYFESWGNGLPDRFNFTGVAMSNGYPAGLGEIKIFNWHAKTASNSGLFCTEQGNMDDNSYDWIFDDLPAPQPTFFRQCWNIVGDTLAILGSVVMDSLPDTISIYEGNGCDSLRVRAFNFTPDPLVLLAAPLPNNSFFIDSGTGGGLFVFCPDYNQGDPYMVSYEISFIASNGTVADTEKVIYQVFNRDRAPVLDYISTPHLMHEGDTLAFMVHAFDPDYEPVILTAEDLPNNSYFYDYGNDSGYFFFVPDSSQGWPGGRFYSILFSAIDYDNNGLRDVQYVVVSVIDVQDTVNLPPNLWSIGNLGVAVGNTLNLVLYAYDPNYNDSLFYTANPMPANANLNQLDYNTAVFSFTPDSTQVGDIPIWFAVSDYEYTDSELVILHVYLDSLGFFRVELSGPGVWYDNGIQKLRPNSDFSIDLYANNNDTIPYTIYRSIWSSPFAFEGNVHISWDDTALIPTAQFRSFWDLFQLAYVAGWDGILPDTFSYIGIAMDNGYWPGLGEIKVLSWQGHVNDSGFITMKMADPPGYVYDWIFEDPVPLFSPVTWFVENDSTISPPPGICGQVIDTLGQPLGGAIVELWIDFPRGTQLATEVTDSSGLFACNIAVNEPFDIYAHKPGYYPGMLVDISNPEGLEVMLSPIPLITPTMEFVFFYCIDNNFLGAPLPVGSVIDAYDPNKIRCGTWYVTQPGKYGFMPVYRDDPYSLDIDEGAEPGDSLTFIINGFEAIPSQTPYWTANGDRHEVCLEVPLEQPRSIMLHQGWNLVSWNVDTPGDYILDLLAPVMECVDVVLGYDNGGFIFDPDLMDYSTLWHLDHYHGYWIRMDCERELIISGLPIPVCLPIPLNADWNLVSYLPSSPDSTEHALGSIMDNIVVALGFDSVALTYDPLLPEFSTLTTMATGFGYWVKVYTEDILVYPGVGPKASYSRPLATVARTAVNNYVKPTRQWVSLYSPQLILNGEMVSEGVEVTAVTMNGKIVGAATVGANGKFGFMPIYADDNTQETDKRLSPGSQFYLIINGVKTSEKFIWTENGDRIEIKALTGMGSSDIVPSHYCLYQNYPNPFNPMTGISFDLPQAADVTLEVFNIAGQKVATIISTEMPAGKHTIQWDSRDANGNQLASGMYLYRLKAGDFADTKKMMLLK